ncbi:hypothetical protein [Deinococcus arcticus]|uniref:Uncharacterized protein n=1 Tax=Deinococcus arcticus TaxID=2136176 RepID=A0A2T3W667_9DEIO|nr:hypothetical protein [Deinococcus arcticus]PTA67396.1 hypothetical protein C8263_12540 [Deinococcus arcticus]
MSWPEDATRQAPAPAATRAPSAALGYLLNVLLPGAGFTLINRWGWHLGWFGIQVGLYLVASILSGATGTLLPLALPFVGFIAMLVHFGRVYAEQRARHFQPPLELAVKLVLILGHFFIGFVLVGILAAVLIPNLLAARTRAQQTGEMAVARAAQLQAVTAQLDQRVQDGPCPLEGLPDAYREQIASCTLTNSSGAVPSVSVTFHSGRTVSLP